MHVQPVERPRVDTAGSHAIQAEKFQCAQAAAAQSLCAAERCHRLVDKWTLRLWPKKLQKSPLGIAHAPACAPTHSSTFSAGVGCSPLLSSSLPPRLPSSRRRRRRTAPQLLLSSRLPLLRLCRALKPEGKALRCHVQNRLFVPESGQAASEEEHDGPGARVLCQCFPFALSRSPDSLSLNMERY